MKKRLILISVVFLLVLSLFSLAETIPGIICEDDIDCQLEFGIDYICDEKFSCSTIDEETVTEEPESFVFEDELGLTEEETTVIPPTVYAKVATVKSLQEKVDSLEVSSTNFQQQLNNIESNIQSINFKLSDIQQVKNEVNSIAVGLAGLQEDLNKTSTELGTIEDDLAKKTMRNKILGAIFFVLLVVAVALGLIYYMNSKRKPFQLDSQIISYITKSIKQGKKFPEIKAILLRAGWVENQIKWAYKETIKKNYRQYLNKAGTKSKTKTTKGGFDKNKIIAIVVVTILLVGGILFLAKGTGQAVYTKKFVGGVEGGTAGEVTYEVKCTPPHLLNPTGDGCCLDMNSNEKCDYIENKQETTELVDGLCTDNFQCQQGKLCINSQCSTLSELYSQQVCDKSCNFYSVKVKVIYSSDTEQKIMKECKTNGQCNDYISETNDVCSVTEEESYCLHTPLIEVYDLKPKQGSYAAAGAIEWKILESPNYCSGEQAVVPIKIIKKNGQEVLSEEIISLRDREISDFITHPLYEGVSFRLKIDKIGKPIGC